MPLTTPMRLFLLIVCACLPFTCQAQNDTIPQNILFTKDSVLKVSYLADTASFVVIRNLLVKGNNRTRKGIILRELDLHQADTIETNKLTLVLLRNRNQVYNTGLFNDVTLSLQNQQGNQADLLVEVAERWYIFPVPIFKLTDRNFNDWWVTHHHDFARTEYGIQFKHENFRGRREKLSLTLQWGYNRKIELIYQIPSLNKNGNTGINPYISYIVNHEIAYQSVLNKQVFWKDTTDFVRKRIRAGIAVVHRTDLYRTHLIHGGYIENHIADTIAQLNPDYFLDGKNSQKYFFLQYVYTADLRNLRAYPLSGSYLRFSCYKAGIGSGQNANLLWLTIRYTHYFPLAKKWYALANVLAKTSFPQKQSYYIQQGLGFGNDYLRGYEYYVIDGQHYGVARGALRFELLKKKFKTPIIKTKQFDHIPVSIYLKTYIETGYVRDDYFAPKNPLNNLLANKFLYSTGVGFDLLTFYDRVLSMEYSLNGEKEWGLFVSFKSNY